MQSLSKSKLPLKLTKIFMVFVLLFSLILQKPKETHAFPLALLLPAISNPATVTALLGVVGIGAVGVTANNSEWYNDNINQLEQTAKTTAGLMTNDMLDNFQTSLNNLIHGFTNTLELSGDLITDLYNTFVNSASGSVSQSIEGITRRGYEFTFTGDTTFTFDGKRDYAVFNLYMTNQGRLGLNGYPFGDLEAFGFEYEELLAITTNYTKMINNPNTTIYDVLNFIEPYFPTQIGRVTLSIGGAVTYPSTENTMPLDNVGDYLTEQLLANNNKLGLNLGINDLVNLRTNQGVPLYVDNAGQVVLRDGRPFEGDLADIVVSNRVPAVTDVAGTLTPTISSDFGLTNIKTGELIIPNPNPPIPNPSPNIKPETTKPLTGIQRFLPAAVVIVFILFLKAIVFYAIRLFDFILTLPLTPSKPINNYAFQWFMDAKILGIQVYDTVLAFAMFAFSLTIYKVIRRIW